MPDEQTNDMPDDRQTMSNTDECMWLRSWRRKPGSDWPFVRPDAARAPTYPTTNMLRFSPRIGSMHETHALVRIHLTIWQHQVMLLCSMTAELLASPSHGEMPPHLHVSVSAESSSRVSAKIKPSVIFILGGRLHSPL